ncbi:MAG: PAS domain S-box protein [Pseudohongiella sp.]
MLIALILATEPLTPWGFAHGLWYVPVILAASFWGDRLLLTLVYSLSIAGVLSGFVISPPPPVDFPLEYVIGNRLMSLVALTAIYFPAMYFYRFRHRSELALQNNASVLLARWHDTIESITDAFFVLDGEFRFTYLNAKAEAILGQSRDALLNTVVWDECGAGYDGPFAPRYREAMQSGQPVFFKAYFEPTEMWLDVRAYPSVNSLAVYFRDVTQECAEQEELRLLRTAIAQLDDFILITKADSVNEPGPEIVFVNDAFEKITGYSAEEAVGNTPRLLQGENTQRGELDRIRHALENWQPVRAQLLNYKKNGDELWLELNIVPIRDDTGVYTHWVAVERDISEQKRLREHLEAAHRMESIGQLTGGIAHDFNNLLTVIAGNAELIEESSAADDPRNRQSRLIRKASARGSALTKSMLAFSKRQALSPGILAPKSLMDSIEPIIKAGVGSKVSISIDVTDGLWNIFVDQSQLESALLNLAINASDAMPAGGRLTIAFSNKSVTQAEVTRFSTINPGDYVVVSVQDTGEGIPEALVGQIFEPFFSTRTSDNKSGLGLSMVFGFVQQSAGHITVQTTVDKGAKFDLWLPAAADGAVANRHSTSRPGRPGAMTGTGGGQQTLLLVEDDEDINNLARGWLVEQGYQVLTASDVSSAFRIIDATDKLDLLFTDIMLPGERSGIDVAKHYQSRHNAGRVVYTSGYSDQLHSHNIGTDINLLAKPYSRQQLLEKLGATLAVSDSA